MGIAADTVEDHRPQPLRGLPAVLHGRYCGAPESDPNLFTPFLAAAPSAQDVNSCAAPGENYAVNVLAASQKHGYPWPKLAVLGVLAGAYIGLGFSLCTLVGGQLSPDLREQQPGVFNLLFGIYGFPMVRSNARFNDCGGLTLCVVAGADLFTSNCMYAVFAVAEGRYGLLGLARCWASSYLCNLAGALLLVGLMLGGDVYHGRSDFVVQLAHKKVSATFGATLCKGILCNWLVCLAVWQGNAARDLTGKFVGVFLPNSAFVSMGFEHCVANMYLVPLSMALGSGISVGTFLTRNLIPATLGNVVGGALFVGAAYTCSFGSPGHAVADMWEAALSAGGACLAGRRTRPAAAPAAGCVKHAESFAHVRDVSGGEESADDG